MIVTDILIHPDIRIELKGLGSLDPAEDITPREVMLLSQMLVGLAVFVMTGGRLPASVTENFITQHKLERHFKS